VDDRLGVRLTDIFTANLPGAEKVAA